MVILLIAFGSVLDRRVLGTNELAARLASAARQSAWVDVTFPGRDVSLDMTIRLPLDFELEPRAEPHEP
jgi:hypothetical protein